MTRRLIINPVTSRLDYIDEIPTGLVYKGTWNANTNTPAISDITGVLGDFYIVSDAGTQDLGSGNITFDKGDWAIHNGTIFQRVDIQLVAGGNNTEVQFNDSNLLAGDSTFTFDKSTDILSVLNLNVAGRTATKTTLKTFADTNYVAGSDEQIWWDTTGGNCVCFLPALASVPDGTTYNIGHLYSSTGGNTLTIDGDGTETIDGELTQVLPLGTNATIQNFNQTEWLVK